MKQDELDLIDVIGQIHAEAFKLVGKVLGENLAVAGNVGVFCQDNSDFQRFSEAARRLTLTSDNPAQKYFQLKAPISFAGTSDTPPSTYSWLYIRKPTADSPEAGDVDFVLSQRALEELKRRVAQHQIVGAKIYRRPGWDMIEVNDPAINALAYVSTREMAEKIRVKFD